MIRATAPDDQGFYRMTLTNPTTGSVTRPVYIRQPEGTVFRVHDDTRHTAIEAVLVDPLTGLNIRSSGVMRSTVARTPNGEWRAVGFGYGGGKRPMRPAITPPEPHATVPDTRISNLIRRSGTWDNEIMDLVPAFMTRLPSWPQHRSLVIIDDRPLGRSWARRFIPGQADFSEPGMAPRPGDATIVLRRTSNNHYDLMLSDRTVQIPADGDCFFNAVAMGLNRGSQGRFTMQGLRNAAAEYFDLHPELNQFVVQAPTTEMQLLYDHTFQLQVILQTGTLRDVALISQGVRSHDGLFLPLRNYLRQVANAPAESPARSALMPISGLLATSAQIDAMVLNREPVRRFLQALLLNPEQVQDITRLLDTPHLILSQAVAHIMLEYGITARQLLNHHPRSFSGYLLWNDALPAHQQELDAMVRQAIIIRSDEMMQAYHLFQRLAGYPLPPNQSVFNIAVEFGNGREIANLLRSSLGRFPALQPRAHMLLTSPLISSYLGGLMNLATVAAWIRNPALSIERLRIIAEYATLRFDEMINNRTIDIDWMRFFDDRTVQNIIRDRGPLTALFEHMRGTPTTMAAQTSPHFTELFSPPGLTPSNSRVAILFEIEGFAPSLWHALWRIEPGFADELWNELLSTQWSDDQIRQLLGPTGRLRTEINEAAPRRTPSPAEE